VYLILKTLQQHTCLELRQSLSVTYKT